MQILIYFLIAISLSMDAFSLSLAYGTNRPSKTKCYITSILVGIFHFVMPNIGAIIGKLIISKYIINTDLLVAVIFLILALQMILSKNKENQEELTSIFTSILFAFAVSIDSFSVGIALGISSSNLLIAPLIFAITSFLFTICGLLLGKKLLEILGKKANYIGIIILLLLVVKYLFF